MNNFNHQALTSNHYISLPQFLGRFFKRTILVRPQHNVYSEAWTITYIVTYYCLWCALYRGLVGFFVFKNTGQLLHVVLTISNSNVGLGHIMSCLWRLNSILATYMELDAISNSWEIFKYEQFLSNYRRDIVQMALCNPTYFTLLSTERTKHIIHTGFI